VGIMQRSQALNPNIGCLNMTDKHNDNLAKLPKEDTDKAVHVREGKKPFIIIAILISIGLVFISKTNIFTSEPSINATGTIISPLNKATLDSEFIVTGETKRVAAGQYAWLAFDNPEFHTCFPKVQVPRNDKFRATIIEKRLTDQLRLSLYVLNEAEHKKWIEWQNTPNFEGIKMPTGRKYLDHANIILK
jgi:hypothetical protein